MADRKESPDVLAELLGTRLPPAPALGAPKQAPAAWETEVVSFQEYHGWRPRYVDGAELPGWMAGPLVHDYLRQRGAEGWELAGVSTASRFYGTADGLQAYFKRRSSRES